MPIYEFTCEDCGRDTSVFTRSVSAPIGDPTCRQCGGTSLRRKISRVAVLHSRQNLYRDYDRLSAFDDAPGDDDYDGMDDDGFDNGFV